MHLTTHRRRRSRLLSGLATAVVLAGVVVGSAPQAGAAGGGLQGPIAGRYWFSHTAKVGANGSVVSYATALRNFDANAPTSPLLMTVYQKAPGGNVPVVRTIDGQFPTGNSYPLAVSPETGTQYTLYSSAASNLVSGDTNGKQDVFLFNRTTVATERVSVGTNGVQANGDTFRAGMSGDTTTGNPRFVVFVSNASNLDPIDEGGRANVFLRDRQTNTTTLISKAPGGAAANGDAYTAVVSDDGNTVAFASTASNLVAGDTNLSTDVFVWKRTAGVNGQISRISIGYEGDAFGASTSPSISADGRFVAFDSDADDIVRDDDNLGTDVFVRDLQYGTTERVSVGPNGEQGDGDSESPSISRDGRYVAFETDVEDWSVDDVNISIDIYVRDRLGQNTQRASEKPDGLDAFSDSTGASISPEGRYVGFDTDSGDFFYDTDINDDYDVYIKDMGTQFWNVAKVGNRFQGVSPTRLLDTRTTGGKLDGPTTRDLKVTGVGGVPSNATAVVLNVTSTEASTANGYVSVGPKGGLDTGTSSLNLQPGASVPNLVTAKVGSGGNISLYTNVGSVHLIVDVFGYYAPDGGDAFTGIEPTRILDTRTSDTVPPGWPARQPLVGGTAREQLDLPVAGTDAVPADARAVVLNVTSTGASTSNGYLTVGPAGALNKGTSNLNLQPGFNVPNLVIVKVGAAGKVSLYTNTGTVDVIVDVVGYYGPFGGGLFYPVNPSRILDTRSPGTNSLTPKLSPLVLNASGDLPVAGTSSVPANAAAVVLNVTSTQPTSNNGFTTVWPTGTERQLVSSLNYRVGVNVPNAVQVKLGAEGKVGLFNGGAGSVQLIADVNGYFR